MGYTLWQSFRHAGRGLKIVAKTEKNFRIQLLIAVLVLLAAWYRHLEEKSFIILLLVMALVMCLEIVNSAIERLVDILAPRTHNFAKEIKDLLAAMVLLASIFAAIIGFVIFI